MEASVDRRNIFDAIRLIAAFMVLVGHAYVLTGAGPAPRIGGIPLHTFGVCIFFAISGYLIAGSWQRHPLAATYLGNRALRIFPALIVVVFVTALFIGPLVTARNLGGYFSSPVTWQYLTNITLFGSYDLPGVFEGAAHTRTAVNGSLWTLGVEFSCYLGLLALMLLIPRRRAVALVVAAVMVGVGAIAATFLPVLSPIEPALSMCAFFFAAAVMRLLMPRGLLRPLPALGALACWLVLATLVPAVAWPAAWVLLSYAVLGIGVVNIPIIRHGARYGDFSYGLYLWAYPVQQVVIDVIGRVPIALNITVVSVITLILAAASWHLVEKRALALKERPGLRLRPTFSR